jgi:hypothetical protein
MSDRFVWKIKRCPVPIMINDIIRVIPATMAWQSNGPRHPDVLELGSWEAVKKLLLPTEMVTA